MTYEEYKKLKKYFWEAFYENGLVDPTARGFSPFTFNELIEEWFNVKSEYDSIDSYIKELVENGFD